MFKVQGIENVQGGCSRNRKCSRWMFYEPKMFKVDVLGIENVHGGCSRNRKCSRWMF